MTSTPPLSFLYHVSHLLGIPNIAKRFLGRAKQSTHVGISKVRRQQRLASARVHGLASACVRGLASVRADDSLVGELSHPVVISGGCRVDVDVGLFFSAHEEEEAEVWGFKTHTEEPESPTGSHTPHTSHPSMLLAMEPPVPLLGRSGEMPSCKAAELAFCQPDAQPETYCEDHKLECPHPCSNALVYVRPGEGALPTPLHHARSRRTASLAHLVPPSRTLLLFSGNAPLCHTVAGQFETGGYVMGCVLSGGDNGGW